MEHNHGGSEDHSPFFSWVICRFLFNLPGCILRVRVYSRTKTLEFWMKHITCIELKTRLSFAGDLRFTEIYVFNQQTYTITYIYSKCCFQWSLQFWDTPTDSQTKKCRVMVSIFITVGGWRTKKTTLFVVIPSFCDLPIMLVFWNTDSPGLDSSLKAFFGNLVCVCVRTA